MASMIERAWLVRGPLSIALLPLAMLYGLVAWLRRSMFKIGWATVHRLDVPVVVVGNLIAGGAGKTPTVMAVAALLQEAGWHPGIVSRGYGGDSATAGGLLEVKPDSDARHCGDEPLLLRRRTGLPVVVGRDRVAAARLLLKLHTQVDVILTDDGLQHARLGRDVEIVVFDERGAGNGFLLPAGPLREPLKPRPGSALVLYNASAPSTPWPGFMVKRQLAGAVALDDWQAGDAASPAVLRSLSGRPVIALAGTARPDRFFDMLRAAGLDIIPMPKPDHDPFDALPWPSSALDVVVTEKDAVKLVGRERGATRIWVAPLDFQPEPEFGVALLAALGTRVPLLSARSPRLKKD